MPEFESPVWAVWGSKGFFGGERGCGQAVFWGKGERWSDACFSSVWWNFVRVVCKGEGGCVWEDLAFSSVSFCFPSLIPLFLEAFFRFEFKSSRVRCLRISLLSSALVGA